MTMRHCAILVHLCFFFLFFFSTLSIGEEETPFDMSDFSLSSGLCDIFKCMKGKCVTTNSIPFYECQCDAGWKSPFGWSWTPCVLPNCTIDRTCSNATSPAPAPAPTFSPTGLFNVCSFPVCGNGDCIQNSTSSDNYQCDCHSGYSNLRNKSDGYCLQSCALGANCQNLNISIGGSPKPPPPPASSNQITNQGSKQICLIHTIIMMATVLLVGLNAWGYKGISAVSIPAAVKLPSHSNWFVHFKETELHPLNRLVSCAAYHNLCFPHSHSFVQFKEIELHPLIWLPTCATIIIFAPHLCFRQGQELVNCQNSPISLLTWNLDCLACLMDERLMELSFGNGSVENCTINHSAEDILPLIIQMCVKIGNGKLSCNCGKSNLSKWDDSG